jgi:hypothetical protein
VARLQQAPIHATTSTSILIRILRPAIFFYPWLHFLYHDHPHRTTTLHFTSASPCRFCNDTASRRELNPQASSWIVLDCRVTASVKKDESNNYIFADNTQKAHRCSPVTISPPENLAHRLYISIPLLQRPHAPGTVYLVTLCSQNEYLPPLSPSRRSLSKTIAIDIVVGKLQSIQRCLRWYFSSGFSNTRKRSMMRDFGQDLMDAKDKAFEIGRGLSLTFNMHRVCCSLFTLHSILHYNCILWLRYISWL